MGTNRQRQRKNKQLTMNEVIELIEEKIEEIKNYSISNQEDESQYMKELGAFEEMLRIVEEI